MVPGGGVQPPPECSKGRVPLRHAPLFVAFEEYDDKLYAK